MPRFKIRDNEGNLLTIEGDSEPTEQELEELFSHSRTRVSNNLSTQQEQTNYSNAFIPDEVAQKQPAPEDDVPYALRLGAAAHTGLQKGMQLPSTIMRVAQRVGMELPSTKIARAASDILGEAFLPKGVNQYRKEIADAIIRDNEDYFKRLDQWERSLSQRDALLGKQDFGIQLAEGTARGFAELPTQLVSGAAGRAAGGVPGAIRGAAAGAGVASGAMTTAQELGEGESFTEAAAKGGTSGLITAMTTRAFGATGVESIFRNEGARGVAARLVNALRQGGYEAAEEMVDQVQQELLEYATDNPDRPLAEAVNNVVLAGSIGGILGTGVSATSAIGGERDASQVREAAPVYGDVRGQPRPSATRQVPTQEGGERVQAQAERGILSGGKVQIAESDELRSLQERFMRGQDMTSEEVDRMEQLREKAAQAARPSRRQKPAMSPEEEAYLRMEQEGMESEFKDAAGKYGYEGEVEFLNEEDMQGDDESLKSGMARWNPITQSIQVNRTAWQEMTPEQRTKVMDSIASEEAIHSKISDADALEFVRQSPWLQRKIGSAIYRKGTDLKSLDDRVLGHEMMRRSLQRLANVKPTEIAQLVGTDRMTVQMLDLLDRTIDTARTALGTNARRSQVEMLDRAQRNIGIARKAIQSGAIQAPQRQKEVEDIVGRLDRLEDVSTDDAVDAGLKAKSIEDLDAILEGRRAWREKVNAIKEQAKSDPSKMAQYAAIVQRGQIYREAIEAATNSGSHRVSARVGREVGLPHPQLDYEKNPEVADWLRAHGHEVGIQIQDQALAAPKRLNNKQKELDYDIKRIHSLLSPMVTDDLGQVAPEYVTLEILDQVINVERGDAPADMPPETLEALRELFASSPEFNELFNSIKKKMDGMSGGEIVGYHEHLISKSNLDSGDQQSFAMSPRRDMTKKDARHIEELRKYREAIGAKPVEEQGPAPGSVSKRQAPRSSRVGAEAFFSPPTPESVEQTGRDILSDQTMLPSFQRFMDHIRSKHGDVKSGQVAEAWADQVWSYLQQASGQELTSLVDRLGLRRQVFGTFRQGRKTVSGEAAPAVERGGTIADPSPADTGGIEHARKRALERADRLTKKADKLELQLRKKDIPEIRQKVEILRRTAENISQAAMSGEGMTGTQQSLFGGEAEIKPDSPYDPSRGPATKQRERAIAIVGRHLLRERPSLTAGLKRTSLGPEDVRWTETGADIKKVAREDLDDLDSLGLELTTEAATDASTQRIAGGGRFKVKEKALPRSATKRVIALKDNRTGAVYLVSGYRDGHRGPVFRDPASITGEHRSLQQLVGRFTPQFSLPLDLPVQNFIQKFENEKAFSDQFAGQVDRMSRRIGWRGFGTTPPIEGSEGLEGEGGFVQGPEADLARLEAGMVAGARESGAEITPEEARSIYEVFSPMETREDIALMMGRLREKAQKNQLTPRDWLMITAMTKVNDSLLELHSGEGKTHGEIADLTLQELYDITKRNQTASSFVASTQRQFTQGRGIPAQAGPTQARPSPFSRELTMPSRRPPTDVSRAEPGQPQVRTGADVARPAGLPVEPVRQPAGVERQLYKERSRLRRIREGATSKREYEPGSYPASGRAEPENVRYEMPEYRRKAIQDRINEIANRQVQQQQAAAQQQAAPEPSPQQEMELGGTAAEAGPINLPREQRPGQQGELLALRRQPGRTVGESAQNFLRDAMSIYDRWMVDRIDEYGGRFSKEAARKFRHIIDRQKDLYGSLTPTLDRARRLSGGIEPSRGGSVGQQIKDVPRRTVESAKAMRAATWLNGLKHVTPDAAVARSVDAIEGQIPVPSWAQTLVDTAKAANLEIGRMLQPVVQGFQATGKFQRNLTGLGYDIMRSGGGPMWDKWTKGLHRANRITGRTLGDVRTYFKNVKKMLDDPLTSGAELERINQDVARDFPNTITHVKHLGRWHEVVHSDLFGYLERAAQRATHVRSFREVFPNTDAGRSDFRKLVEASRSELTPEIQRDLDGLVRAMNGHPTDDYSGGNVTDLLRMGPSQTGGVVARAMNQSINNLLAKMVLTGQLVVQPGEVLFGSAPVNLGWKNYLRGMARAASLYDQMEITGMVNRVMRDYTFNPNSPIRSAFKIAGNLVSKATLSDTLNEVQEALAASTAWVVSERIASGNLSEWEQRMLPLTFRDMGFSPAEVRQMMRGDQNLLGQFRRKAAAYYTSGNKSLAEGSRTGSYRLFNSIFRFQSYPMMKMNQARNILTNWIEAERVGTVQQKKSRREQAARFFFGNVMQGAFTVMLTSLAFGGLGGLKIRTEEAEDEPFRFLFESFLSSMSGPFYMLWRGARMAGGKGLAEQAARAAFPYSVMTELNDMASSNGKYRDTSTFGKIGKFLESKTPATKLVRTGLALAGLTEQNQPLEQAIQGLNRWKVRELGFDERQSVRRNDEREEFRTQMRSAVKAMQEGNEDAYREAWSKAVDAQGLDAVRDSLNRRKLLVDLDGKELTEELKEKLQQRIGMEAYELLEWYDLMVEAAADGNPMF